MVYLLETVVGSVVTSRTAYFGRIRDNLSQSWKHHISMCGSNIPVASSGTHVFHSGVPPMLDSSSDITNMAVKT